MFQYRIARRVSHLLAVAFTLLTLSCASAAFASALSSADVTYVPVTGTIDRVFMEFEVPDVTYEPPVALVLQFPDEMRADRLRGTDIRVAGDVRPPAVSSTAEGVVLSFNVAPAPGSELEIRVSGLTTPDEPGDYQVTALWGPRGDEVGVGEVSVEAPQPNPIQAALRAMEHVPFLRQFFSPTIIWNALPLLWRGFQVAVLILAVSYTFGIPLGLTLAFMKMARFKVLRWPATAFIDVVRGTPLLVQLLLVYFGITFVPGWSELMGALGPLATWQIYAIDATQFYRAFLVLSFNSSAYLAEIFRAGIQSIHKGQLEAARSLGMTWPASMAFVIIPQTVRRILPTMMSEFILLFKDTSILFAVGIFELTLQARTIQAATFNMSPYIAAAGFYLMLTIPLGRFVANLEERLSVAETGRGKAVKRALFGGRLFGTARPQADQEQPTDGATKR